MSVLRLWRCPECQVKYWPTKGWNHECPKCEVLCKMLIEEEAEDSDANKEGEDK